MYNLVKQSETKKKNKAKNRNNKANARTTHKLLRPITLLDTSDDLSISIETSNIPSHVECHPAHRELENTAGKGLS